MKHSASGEYAKVLSENKAELQARKAEIERIINEVQDAEIRLILKMKFVDQRSWNYISRMLHYDRSTVYKKYKRFIQAVS